MKQFNQYIKYHRYIPRCHYDVYNDVYHIVIERRYYFSVAKILKTMLLKLEIKSKMEITTDER